MYFAKIHDFTAGVYPNLFFTATFKIDDDFTRIAKSHQRISVSRVNGPANSQSSQVILRCLFLLLPLYIK